MDDAHTVPTSYARAPHQRLQEEASRVKRTTQCSYACPTPDGTRVRDFGCEPAAVTGPPWASNGTRESAR